MKIIKKQDITNLVESTMKQAGLLQEGESLEMEASYMEEEDGMCEGEGCMDIEEADKPDYIDLDKDGDKEESMKKAAKDKEEMDESIEEKDIVTESAEKLAEEASKPNVISEGLKKELDKFNKITNYKY
jgi:hypothetical protein